MIIARAPLRLPIGGGGTDLPSYYREHGGFLISAAIDKYVYITLHQTFVPELILKYSKLERVLSVDEIQHPLFREAFKLLDIPVAALELASMADIPAGTGLGSSGSFTCALLKVLHAFRHESVPAQQIAEEACRIELDILKEPIGKQDQYIAAYGGLTAFRFLPNDHVEVTPVRVSKETLCNLEDNLTLFFTGYTRSASAILKDQDSKTKSNDRDMINNLHFINEIGRDTKLALETGDLYKFADLMNIHWERKKKRSSGMSNETIDQWYTLALANGALGGKLIGAGGGGFLMFYCEDKARLRKAMRDSGLSEVRFRFDFQGTSVVVQN